MLTQLGPSLTVFALQALDDETQCLFLRLFLRKGPWFRLDTLSYSELTNTTASAQELCQAELATALYPFAAHNPTPAASAKADPDTETAQAVAKNAANAIDITVTQPDSETAVRTSGSENSVKAQDSEAVVTHAAASAVPALEESSDQNPACSASAASNCPLQLVFEVAEALTVPELQLLLGKLELTCQGRATGISKGQMLQLLQSGLEQVRDAQHEVTAHSLFLGCLLLCSFCCTKSLLVLHMDQP